MTRWHVSPHAPLRVPLGILTFYRRFSTIVSVYRIAAVILVACYLALGFGAVERWHNAQHAIEDAVTVAAAHQSGVPAPQLPSHNDSNCLIHAQLHMSAMAVAWVPLLIVLGLFVAFLTQLPVQVVAIERRFALACRGPPVC